MEKIDEIRKSEEMNFEFKKSKPKQALHGSVEVRGEVLRKEFLPDENIDDFLQRYLVSSNPRFEEYKKELADL